MKNKETPRPIDPKNIRVGDRVVNRFEYENGDASTYELTVTETVSEFIHSSTRGFVKDRGTWTLLDRPAPLMDPLPTLPGSVIWVDAIDGETLGKPVKAFLDTYGYWLFTKTVSRRGAWQGTDITAWHPVEPECRTVSTAEELDALLTGAVIRDALGIVAEHLANDEWVTTTGTQGRSSRHVADYWTAPFTVLWEGEK